MQFNNILINSLGRTEHWLVVETYLLGNVDLVLVLFCLPDHALVQFRRHQTLEGKFCFSCILKSFQNMSTYKFPLIHSFNYSLTQMICSFNYRDSFEIKLQLELLNYLKRCLTILLRMHDRYQCQRIVKLSRQHQT